MTARVLRTVAPALFFLLFACAASTPSSEWASSGRGAIAEIHRHKCSRCHSLPEPKTRTREHLTEAFGRHKRRVHLTAAQWASMVEYLQAPESTAGHDR